MMSRIYEIVDRVRALLFGTRLDRQIEEELASHLDMLTEDNVRRGMEPEKARREALLKMGSRTSAIELHREVRGLPLLEDLIKDVRQGARLIGRNPLFALTAALSLALGIGADVTVFSLANKLLF